MKVQEEIKLKGELAYLQAIIKAAEDVLKGSIPPEQKVQICLDILAKRLD